MALVDTLLGKPLASSEQDEQRWSVWTAIPALGLDGLSSAAYGPEAALTILVPAGLLGLRYIGPIMLIILVLLAVLYLSYRQTIAAYPGGGGSYTVAKTNLGQRTGLLAAAALLVDYILNVAVGISAGIGALVSAVPELHSHVLGLCLATLVIITLVNLRGARESGIAFALPTYLFAGTLAIVIVVGLVKALLSGGHPQPVQPLPPIPVAEGGVSLWLLLRAFASGCTAMTGVEAVSNGVPAFSEPRVRNAQRTLTLVVGTLALLLGGIAYLASAYGIQAMDPEKAGYQSTISILTAAVTGRGLFYYLTLGSVLAVLCLSANTSFAGFPRLCRIIALDNYLPHSFAYVGRRLVFSAGIIVLAVLSGGLLILFGGITDRLIPLFAVGAFGAFTLSQAGMIEHWRRLGGRGSGSGLFINGLGAVATGTALLVILAAKFTEGAWVTVGLIPAMLFLFTRVRAHYERVALEICCVHALDTTPTEPPIVVMPVDGWTTISARALRFALTLSEDVIGVHVATDEEYAKALRSGWKMWVQDPLAKAGRTVPRFVSLPSPYRRFFLPFLNFVDQLKAGHQRTIAVIIPELVQRHWYENWLHNHKAMVLKALLLFYGGDRVVVANVPWYLGEAPTEDSQERAKEKLRRRARQLW